MKKISALIITLVFVLVISACGQPTNSGGNEQVNATISADEALDIALREAGAAKENITRLRNELDRDDGTLVYEIEFDFSGKEYDYEVNAKTGAIRERDMDIAEFVDD